MQDVRKPPPSSSIVVLVRALVSDLQLSGTMITRRPDRPHPVLNNLQAGGNEEAGRARGAPTHQPQVAVVAARVMHIVVKLLGVLVYCTSTEVDQVKQEAFNRRHWLPATSTSSYAHGRPPAAVTRPPPPTTTTTTAHDH